MLLAQLATIPHEAQVPDSWLEELLALCLADPELGPVVPQYRIRRPDGSVVAKTDIGLPDVKLGLEGHSRRFHFGPTSSRSTSNATWPWRRAAGSCSTSAGTPPSARPRARPCDRAQVTHRRPGGAEQGWR